MINKTMIAQMYNISLPTLRKRLQLVNMYDKKKRLYSPDEVLEIFQRLGDPKTLANQGSNLF